MSTAPAPIASLQTGIVYGQAGGQHLVLDASVPRGDEPFPVVILVHGGGWSGGDRSGGGDIQPLLKPLTDAGFTWFSIDYRLAPGSRWPACWEDVQTAIRWVKAHAKEYKGDPQRIALIGYSAGAHLVCLSVTEATEATRVQSVVALAAPTDLVSDTERRGGLGPSLQNLLGRSQTVDDITRRVLSDLSPLNHVRPGLPPFLLIHGNADKSVPYGQSLAFQARLRQDGVLCDLVTIPGGPHRLSEWQALNGQYAAKMVDWLARSLGAARS